MNAALLAHQGGWDEVLMVLVPIAIFAILLVVANRRADAIESGRPGGDGGDGGEDGRGGGGEPDRPAGAPRRHHDGPATH